MKKQIALPSPNSLQRRVLDALYQYRTGAAENVLMDAHGTDSLAPTMWRQGPYRALKVAGLIEQVNTGFNNSSRWQLTEACRALMLAERAQQLQGSESDAPAVPQLQGSECDAPAVPQLQGSESDAPAVPQLVPSRQAPEFVPLDPAYYSRAPHREGAWDFKNIPSRYADQGTSPKCA